MSSSRSFSKAALCGALAVCAVANARAQQPLTVNDSHVIRVWGYDGLSPQLLRWEDDYRKLHPEIRFDNQLHGAAAVMAGLYDGVADVALMGREIWPVETMAYHWVYQEQPFGVTVATAGLHAPGQLFTPVVIVNAKNPLTSITLAQLDAIYGSEHRAAPANIRTWGDLGLKGAWADEPIHPYGFGPEDALGVYFRQTVLRSDFKPNTDSNLLSDRDGSRSTAAARIVQAVAADPYAIGYASLQDGAGVKALAVAGEGAPLEPTEATVAARHYPLTRSVWIYFHREHDKPLAPKVDAFVRYLLSAQGQGLIGPSAQLMPLPPEMVDKQIQKLDRPMPAVTVVEDEQ